LRAGALLLLILFVDGSAGSTDLDSTYEVARTALARGELDRARSMAVGGRASSAATAEQRELFALLEAETLVQRGQAPAAMELIARTPQSGAPRALVRRLMTHGYALTVGGDHLGAEQQLARAAAIAAKRVPDLSAEIALLRCTPAFRLNQFERQARLARDAIAGARQHQQFFILANALNNLGLAEMNRDQWEDALDHFNRAARLARALGATWSSAVMTGNVGWCYQQLGDLDEAASRFQVAERVAEELGVLRYQPTWLANIANVYLARRQFAEALPYAERSLAAAQRYGESGKLATSLSNLALVQIALGRYDIAARLNDDAAAIWRRLEDHRNQRYTLLNAAQIDAATGNAERALVVLAKLAREAADQPPLRWQAQALAAAIESRRGHVTEAEALYEAALETGDSARAAVQESDAYLFAFETNLIRFYDEMIDLLITSGRKLDALRVAERSRGRTLLEGKGVLKRGHAAQRSLDARALARRYSATILSYWLAPEHSLVWVVTADEVTVVPLSASAAVNEEIKNYRDEIVRGRASVNSVHGARLYQTLVAPAVAVAHAPTSRFIIVPDGRLEAMNFETFIVPAPAPHYWIEDATVTYTPSLTLLAADVTSRGVGAANLLVMGNIPPRGAEFPALGRAGEEINDVARHFAPGHRVVLEAQRATPAAYTASNPRQFDYVHFVAHGMASAHAPLDSAVVLAGGNLTGHEIVKSGLTAKLVTVSSCNSAGSRTYAGEGLVGLAWAFLRAGSRRVVAAQWDVSDTATPTLMDAMYRELASGRDPASALREAKLGLLHSRTIYSRPFYWAPFILYGAP
jgi:CHAT domain-containing protein